MDNLDKLPCGYFSMSVKGEITKVNRAFTELVEYSTEELIDKSFEEMLSIANKIIYNMAFMKLTSENEVLNELYLTLKTKNNGAVPIILNASNTEGEINCIVIRIDKRTNYERQLKEVKSELHSAYSEKNKALERESKLRELFETTFNSINEGIIVTDIYENIVMMNEIAERYTGYNISETKGKNYLEVFNLINSVSLEKINDISKNAFDLEFGKSYADNLLLLSKDGRETYVTINVGMMTSSEGAQTGIIIAFMDRTVEYIQKREIDGFLNVNLDMLAVSDTDGYLHKVNKKFEEVLGYTTEELLNRKFLDFVHERDVDRTINAMRDIESKLFVSGFINRYLCKDGTYKYLQWNAERGPGKYVYASAKDVTENHLKVKELNEIAEKDELTGTYNRYYLAKISDKLILDSELEESKLSLSVIDLDNFKQVNDNYGHPVGDEILKHSAFLIKSNIRNSDILIRVGGEEFLVIFKDTNEGQAFIAAEKIRAAFENFDFPKIGRQTISIGLTEKKGVEQFHELYNRADSALLSAKYLGRNNVQLF